MGLAAAFGFAAVPMVATVSDTEAQTVGRTRVRSGAQHVTEPCEEPAHSTTGSGAQVPMKLPAIWPAKAPNARR